MKKYKCPDRIIVSIMWGLLLMFVAFVNIFYFSIIIPQFDKFWARDPICMTIFSIGLAVLVVVTFLKTLPQHASSLTFLEDGVIWKCPFYKKVKMNYSECVYVGVENSYDSLKGNYRSILKNHGRGDEFHYIYLSSQPFPNKYKNKAAAAKCNKEFIKFAYSDDLCKTLIEFLPASRVGSLISFYNRMQAVDREKSAKKRKSKKK